MKFPLISRITPPAVAPLRAALAVGQVLPVRLVTPEDAQDLVAISKALVVETTMGLARLHPVETRPAPLPPAPRPAAPAPAMAMAMAMAMADGKETPRLLLEIVSLAPLRVRLLPAETPPPGQEGRPQSPPPPGAELDLEWLPRPAPRTAGEPQTGPAPGAAPRLPPGSAAQAATSAATAPLEPVKREALVDALQVSLRQLLPQQGDIREEWPRLLRLVERLQQQPSPAPAAPPAPALSASDGHAPGGETAGPVNVLRQLAALVVEDVMAELPDVRVLREALRQSAGRPPSPDGGERPGREAMPPRPEPGRAAPAAAEPPVRDAALKLLARLLGTPRSEAPPAAPPPRLREGGDLRLPIAPPRQDWPGASRALVALLHLAGRCLPPPTPESARASPLAPPLPDNPPPLADPGKASLNTGQERTPGAALQFLRQLLAQSGEARSVPASAPPTTPPSAATPATRITPSLPAELVLLQELATPLERLAARSQGQQLNQLNQALNAPGVHVWELPIRDGRGLDLMSLRIEEREEAPGSTAPAGKTYWSCQLQFDFPQLGPIRAMLHWREGQVDTRFFAEREPTVELLNRELGWLNAALMAAGISAALHPCQAAQLTPPPDKPDLGHFNVSV